MMPASSAEAKALGLARYFTGRPCKNGHVAERRADNGTCIDCAAIRSSEWAKQNPDKMRSAQREYYARNAPERRAAMREYAAANTEKRRDNMKRWYEDNKERMRELNRKWFEANKVRLYARQAARRAKHRKAIPPWLTREDFMKMEAMYAEARRLTTETGIPHHVDHIVPLNGELISGLHCPGNLRVVTAAENTRKKNSILPQLVKLEITYGR